VRLHLSFGSFHHAFGFAVCVGHPCPCPPSAAVLVLGHGLSRLLSRQAFLVPTFGGVASLELTRGLFVFVARSSNDLPVLFFVFLNRLIHHVVAIAARLFSFVEFVYLALGSRSVLGLNQVFNRFLSLISLIFAFHHF